MRAGTQLTDADRERAIHRLWNAGIPMSMGSRMSTLAAACATALGALRPHNDADRVALIRRWAEGWSPAPLPPIKPLRQTLAMERAMERCTEYSSMPSFWDKQKANFKETCKC